MTGDLHEHLCIVTDRFVLLKSQTKLRNEERKRISLCVYLRYSSLELPHLIESETNQSQCQIKSKQAKLIKRQSQSKKMYFP